MNLHEYQAKRLLADYAIPTTQGKLARSLAEAVLIATELGGTNWIVKAQIHAGGRGKAGGVQRATSLIGLEQIVERLLGSQLITQQTGSHGLPVDSVLIERPCDIRRELYLALTVDRMGETIIVMASGVGGMDIEEIAHTRPEKIITIALDPLAGLSTGQCHDLAEALELRGPQAVALADMVRKLCSVFAEKDASLIEINPLIVTGQGELLALDAKIQLDDNALYRHAYLNTLRDTAQEDPRESQAREFGLNYITLDGNIACMVNGAGLAMATMDLIKLHGGEPANFLDVGGGTSAARVAQAFKLILSDKKVKAILVNIFGGIVRCDLIAEGIIQAASDVAITIPVIARLEGTNVERGRELLANSGLNIISATDLTDAAQKAVASAGRQTARNQQE